MKNSLIFTAADFKNPDGDAASPEGAAIIANDRSAKVLACLSEIRKLVYEGIDCDCVYDTAPYNGKKCPACLAIENIDKMTTVVEASDV